MSPTSTGQGGTSFTSLAGLVAVWTASGPIFALRNQFIGISDVEVKVMRWYHHCFSYDYSEGTYSMVLDGSVVAQGEHMGQLGNLTRVDN